MHQCYKQWKLVSLLECNLLIFKCGSSFHRYIVSRFTSIAVFYGDTLITECTLFALEFLYSPYATKDMHFSSVFILC